MKKYRLISRSIALIFAAVFIFSFVTVEPHHSHFHPWFKYPGFLDSEAEIAVAEDFLVTVEIGEVGLYRTIPRPVPYIDRTTLLLNICRAPPSL